MRDLNVDSKTAVQHSSQFQRRRDLHRVGCQRQLPLLSRHLNFGSHKCYSSQLQFQRGRDLHKVGCQRQLPLLSGHLNFDSHNCYSSQLQFRRRRDLHKVGCQRQLPLLNRHQSSWLEGILKGYLLSRLNVGVVRLHSNNNQMLGHYCVRVAILAAATVKIH